MCYHYTKPPLYTSQTLYMYALNSRFQFTYLEAFSPLTSKEHPATKKYCSNNILKFPWTLGSVVLHVNLRMVNKMLLCRRFIYTTSQEVKPKLKPGTVKRQTEHNVIWCIDSNECTAFQYGTIFIKLVRFSQHFRYQRTSLDTRVLDVITV